MKNIESKQVRKRLREYAEKSISNTNNKEILKRLLKYQSKLKSKNTLSEWFFINVFR